MKTNIKTSSMHIRVNPEVKERAIHVLDEIGISVTDLFNMLLNQVAIQHKIPFELVDSKYVCAHGYLHNYEGTSPSDESEYQAFDSWKDAKEWIHA